MKVAANILLAAAAVALLPAVVEGAIWRVELDGTGDFTSIQDAVDAAEPGDTILVGPGHYAEVRPLPSWPTRSATVGIYKSGLVIEGAGVDQTFIGADYIDFYYKVIFATSAPGVVTSFTLRDVSLIGGYDCIHYEGQSLTVERCIFRNSHLGISLFSSSNFTITESTFVGIRNSGGVMDTGVMSWGAGVSGGLIEDCQFVKTAFAIGIQATRDVRIVNCVMTEVVQAAQFEQSSTGEITGCHATAWPGLTGGGGIIVISGSRVNITDCVIDWSMSNVGALTVSNQGVVSGQSNVFRGGGGSRTIRALGPQAFQGFRGNEIYPANPYSVVAQYITGSLTPPVHLDMTGNYWGTDDADQIAEWIEDYHDHPDHLHYRMIVDYIPFEGASVGTVPTSLSDVKNLFR